MYSDLNYYFSSIIDLQITVLFNKEQKVRLYSYFTRFKLYSLCILNAKPIEEMTYKLV